MGEQVAELLAGTFDARGDDAGGDDSGLEQAEIIAGEIKVHDYMSDSTCPGI